jgi:glutathione S-transferase
MRSLWLLYELNIKFELVEMPFDQKYTRSPEYLSVHPLGRVPCLVHNDLTLYESGAICQYLCEVFDKGDQLERSLNHKEHSEWLQWLHYAETIAVHGASLVQQHIIIAEELRSPVVIKLESRRLEKSLEVLDNHLKGRDYLLKSGFSAVDTSVGWSVHMGNMFIKISDFKNVENYYNRLKNRDAFKKSLPKDVSDPLEKIEV